MKKAVIVLVCAALLCGLVIPQSVLAQSAGGYEITGYDFKAVISENNVYDITETINVHFNEERHGIYRDIPVNEACRIYDVNVEGDTFTVENSSDTVTIKIGDPDNLIIGDKTYRISYKGAVKDTSINFDEVYYNIIGTGWDTVINNVTFSITLPKEFDTSMVGFSVGEYGVSGYDPAELKYTVNRNTVSGSMERLNPYEGVTMRIELPEGYFIVPEKLVFPDWMGEIALRVILLALAGR